jgi:Xaa-Pro dipeptidase
MRKNGSMTRRPKASLTEPSDRLLNGAPGPARNPEAPSSRFAGLDTPPVRKVDRRGFLRAGAALAAAAATVRGVMAREETARAEPAVPPSAPSLPPPLTREFHLGRLQQSAELMRAQKVSHLVCAPGPDLFYLTGLALERGDRFSGLIAPVDGPAVLLCPVEDRGIVESGPGVVEEIVYYDDTEDPLTLAVKQLKKGNASSVALSGRIWYEEFVPLYGDLPKLTFSLGYPFVGALRRIKSLEEIALIETAARMAREAAEWGVAGLREGMREEDIEMSLVTRLRARGSRALVLVQSGPRTLAPRAHAGDRAIGRGDTVVITCETEVRGYRARVSRSAVLGGATGRMKTIQQTIVEGQGFVFERVKPSIPAPAIDQTMRAALGKRGFLKQLLHTTGAGCGLEYPEPPFLGPGYFERLAQGDVFTVGQGVYTPGDYGLRQEDVLLVTADGARWLSTPATSLVEIGA